MAPVGSFESLQAAIRAGADSVYFGLNKLNMRARSSANFTPDDLDRIMEICNFHGVRTYLTINIVVYDNEMDQVRELIDLARQKEITAIIACDMAVISYAHSQGVEVHMSTQLNISNIDAVSFYSEFAEVMVLARELNLEQVQLISKSISEENINGPGGNPVRLEIFIHGALCMSISGKCYLSLHEHNYSANRGACLQDCRRAYTVTEKETGHQLDIENEYIMSPKDLCTIHFLNKIIDAGVRVLKIEGRARPAEYVYTTVQCYREAVDSILDGSYSKVKIKKWMERLSKVFNRGFWDGYYLGQRLGEWSHSYGSRATHYKVYVGKGMNYFSNLGVAEFQCEAAEIHLGDEFLITGPTTGIIEGFIEEIRVDLKPTDVVHKGERFSIPLGHIIRRADKLFRIVKSVQMEEVR